MIVNTILLKILYKLAGKFWYIFHKKRSIFKFRLDYIHYQKLSRAIVDHEFAGARAIGGEIILVSTVVFVYFVLQLKNVLGVSSLIAVYVGLGNSRDNDIVELLLGKALVMPCVCPCSESSLVLLDDG